MTKTAQFRVQLPLALRDMFKATCLRKNVTMTDRVVRLIEHDITGISQTQNPASQPIKSLNDDRLIARVVDASDKLGTAAASLSTSLYSALDDFGARLLSSVPKPQTPEQRARRRMHALEQDQERLETMLGKAENLNNRIIEAIEHSQRRILHAMEVKRNMKQATALGVAGGLTLAIFMLWAISGTSAARSIAIGLIATDSSWQAAKLIAGDGSLLHGAYMSETHTLLKNPEFRESYTRCVQRAKASKTSFKCTVRFPLLRPAD
jgi:hypothetical protein